MRARGRGRTELERVLTADQVAVAAGGLGFGRIVASEILIEAPISAANPA
jgi:hypothetical protein